MTASTCDLDGPDLIEPLFLPSISQKIRKRMLQLPDYSRHICALGVCRLWLIIGLGREVSKMGLGRQQDCRASMAQFRGRKQ
jgi:hypothetical protein